MAPRPALQEEPAKCTVTAHGSVTILHPSRIKFPKGRRLLQFPAFDSEELASGQCYGVLRSLVMDACRILVNNQDVYLATDIGGQQRCPAVTEQTLLHAGEYYLFPVGGTIGDDYAVVTNFNAWTFPHDNTPSSWGATSAVACIPSPSSAMSESVKLLDGRCCVVTKFKSAKSSECARLCPREYRDWFMANDMRIYTHGGSPNDVANGVCMRADVHRCFNAHGFVIYPAYPAAGSSFATYVVDAWEPDYAELLHWRLVNIPDRVFPELLYARFALAVIQRAYPAKYPSMFKAVPVPAAVLEVRAERLAESESSASDHSDGSELGGMSDAGDLELRAERVASESSDHSDDPEPGEQSDMSDADEDQPVALDDDAIAATFYRVFPHLREEREHSTDRHYNTLVLHPETSKMRKLMEEYKKKNPQVSQVSGPTAMHSDVEEDAEDDAEDSLDLFADFVGGGSHVLEGAEGVEEAPLGERDTEDVMASTGDDDRVP